MSKAIAFVGPITTPPARTAIRWGAVLPAPVPYSLPSPKNLALTGVTPYWSPRWYDILFDRNLSGNRFLQAWINILSSGGGAKKSDEIGKMLTLLGLVPASVPSRHTVRFGTHIPSDIAYIPSGGKELRLAGLAGYAPPNRNAIALLLLKRLAINFAAADNVSVLRALSEASGNLFSDLAREIMRSADFLAWAKVAQAINTGNVFAAFDVERTRNISDIATLLWLEQEGAVNMAADLSARKEAANNLIADLARVPEIAADILACLYSYEQGDAGAIEAGMDMLRDKAVADLIEQLADAAAVMADLLSSLARETEAHVDAVADLRSLSEDGGDILAIARGMRQAQNDLEALVRVMHEFDTADAVAALVVLSEVAGADILSVAALINVILANAEAVASLITLQESGADLRALARLYREETTDLAAEFPLLRPRAGENDWGVNAYSDLALASWWTWKHARAHLFGDLVWRIYDIARWDVNIDLVSRIAYRQRGTLLAMLRIWHAATDDAASNLIGRLGKRVPRSQQMRHVIETLDHESDVATLLREGVRYILLCSAERGILTREVVAEALKRLKEVA